VFTWRSTLTPDASFAAIALPQLFVGLGTTTLFLPLTTLALADIKPAQMATAAGLQNFVRTLFAAFNVAAATTYWSNGIVRHHAVLAEHVTDYGAATQSTLATLRAAGSPAESSLAFIDMEISRQAAVMALSDYCRLAAVLVILMVPLIWLAHRPKSAVDMTALH
jgi:DHA2 family multidrug resistance protein